MVHVPYRGAAPAVTDLISGQAQFFAAPTSVLIEHIRAGTVRPLAVTISERSEALPDIPTVAETMPGYEASTWFGLGVPKSTPAQIINKLNQEANVALANPKIKGRLAEVGGIVLAGSPDDFGKFIADETEKWGQVIRAANIKSD
jgi:tripartite-type tricarboxylate transporter receptor subunit TctC